MRPYRAAAGCSYSCDPRSRGQVKTCPYKPTGGVEAGLMHLSRHLLEEPGDFAGEGGVRGAREIGVGVEEALRFAAGELDEARVEQAGDAEVGQAGLERPEELARPAHLEVGLGAIVGAR